MCVVQLHHKSECFFQNQKVSSEDAESFFRRTLALLASNPDTEGPGFEAMALYVHKFLKNGVALLTDLRSFV